jgi:CopG family nickel-responsive transcriptional regulator
MAELIRTGISLERELLEMSDRAIGRKGYTNRSKAIRDLVRDYAVSEDIEANRTVVGTLTLVYNHHKPGLSERINEVQHHAGQKVLAATRGGTDPHVARRKTRKAGPDDYREGVA